MPATSSLEEQAIDREYPQQQRQHHRRHQELQPEQPQFNFRDPNRSETVLQSQLNNQQDTDSGIYSQHQQHHQNPSISHTQSNTRLVVPSVPGVRSTSPSSSVSPLPTPSISPSASAISIDAPYSSRGPSSPIQTPSSTSAEAHGGHPQRESSEHNSSERASADSYSHLHQERNPSNMASWSGQPAIRGNSEAVRMILLSFVTIGITFTWGIEMTYCTPYLLNLGLTKSNTSLVWIAGPLSGLVVQPVVGVIADESKSKWGRRRPLMVIGSIIVAISLLILGFTREIIGYFITDEEAAKRPTIVLAVLAIYVVDFAINAGTVRFRKSGGSKLTQL
jgi:solute carrier family 45 protein 1/2/4